MENKMENKKVEIKVDFPLVWGFMWRTMAIYLLLWFGVFVVSMFFVLISSI